MTYCCHPHAHLSVLICSIWQISTNLLSKLMKKLPLLLFFIILLIACQPKPIPQPAAIPPAAAPTSLPVETLASSITDMVGVWWFPKIGLIEFKADGTILITFGGTLVDTQTYTFDNGKVAWSDPGGTCKDKPATYEAYVTKQAGKPGQLRMQVVGSDPCSDRANALSSPGKIHNP